MVAVVAAEEVVANGRNRYSASYFSACGNSFLDDVTRSNARLNELFFGR